MNHNFLIFVLIPTDHLGPSGLTILAFFADFPRYDNLPLPVSSRNHDLYIRHDRSPHRAVDSGKHTSLFRQSSRSRSPRNRDSYDHDTTCTGNFHRSSRRVPRSRSRSRSQSRQRSHSRQRSDFPSRSSSPPRRHARPSSFSPDSGPSEQDFEDSFLTSMTQ